MPPILLATINARYSHPSLGMRYLLANLGPLRSRAILREFTLQDSPERMAAEILSHAPALVALGIYIWNRVPMEQLVRQLKQAQPTLPIVLGGPEIAYDTGSDLAKSATCVVCNEADLVLAGVCEALMEGRAVPSEIRPERPDLARIALPYEEYTDADLAHRILYVETSRGCPNHCEFCASSITPGIRYFDLDRILPALQRLLDRGATAFKFVDRTFNVHPQHACALLDFFIERWRPELCLHLEMTPRPLDPGLRRRLTQFPPGGLHLEVGIQTFNADVARRIRRATDPDTAEATLRFLIGEAGANVHADLIAGLPGETPASFEAGFDRLAALAPAEIQVGILKRLHGAAIVRHTTDWDMHFRSEPPYDILSTNLMDARYLEDVRRFAQHWERIVNRHLLPHAAPLIWQDQPSAWNAFNAFSLLAAGRLGPHSFGLVELAGLILEHLTRARQFPAADIRRILREDYLANGRRISLPKFLRDEAPPGTGREAAGCPAQNIAK